MWAEHRQSTRQKSHFTISIQSFSVKSFQLSMIRRHCKRNRCPLISMLLIWWIYLATFSDQGRVIELDRADSVSGDSTSKPILYQIATVVIIQLKLCFNQQTIFVPNTVDHTEPHFPFDLMNKNSTQESWKWGRAWLLTGLTNFPFDLFQIAICTWGDGAWKVPTVTVWRGA